MIEIDLAPLANQSVAVRLDNALYEIVVRTTSGVMSVDILRGGELAVQGQRAAAGSPLIPYVYLEAGNFIFVTENEEYADWRKFGTSHFLLYATAQELADIRQQYADTVARVANRQSITVAVPFAPGSTSGFLLARAGGARLLVSPSGGFLFARVRR